MVTASKKPAPSQTSSPFRRRLKAVVRRRERHCSRLEQATVTEILGKALELSPGIQAKLSASSSSVSRLISILYHHLCVSTNRAAPCSTRRNALKIARTLLGWMDAAEKEDGEIDRQEEDRQGQRLEEEERRRKTAEEEERKQAAAAAAEELRKRAEEEEKKRIELQKQLAMEQRRREVEEEKRRKQIAAEEEAKKKAEEERKKAEEEAKKRAAEEARKREEEQRRQAEEKLKREKEEEQRRLAEEQRQQEARAAAHLVRRNAELDAILQAGIQAGNINTHFSQDMHSLNKSGAIYNRKPVFVRFSQKTFSRQQADNLSSRMAKWDPFWKVTHYVSCGMTSLVQNPVSVNWPSHGIQGEDNRTFRCSAAMTRFEIRQENISDINPTDWGTRPLEYAEAQKRLLLFMYPVTPCVKDKRADAHLWPKGTFLVVNDTMTATVEQRRQQSHDEKYWNGQCKPFDLTELIRNPTANKNEVKLLSYDDKPFYFCIALVQFVSSGTLYDLLLHPPSPLAQPLLEKLSREESIAKAKTFTQQAVALDDDDGNDNNVGAAQDTGGKFVFTLTCPFSKTIMTSPVRGIKCKHYQCFDLRNYLDSNRIVNGQRWRCFVCEDHLSYDELQLCSLTMDLIQEFRGELVPTARDRIEFRSNGTYHLLEMKKDRYRKKRAATKDETSPSAVTSMAKQNKEPEIIMLD